MRVRVSEYWLWPGTGATVIRLRVPTPNLRQKFEKRYELIAKTHKRVSPNGS